MHNGELLFSKKYGEPDGRRRGIFSPPAIATLSAILPELFASAPDDG
jgi:hypothetical protein